jgi:hypothetical protein
MQELVDFLIEERYCNSELEAVKILESVSDGFYEYLIERSTPVQRSSEASNVAGLRTKLKSIMNSMVSEKDPERKKELAQQYKSIQDSIKDASLEEKGTRAQKEIQGKDNPASRPTPNRGRSQKPKNVPTGKTTRGSYSNINRNNSDLEQQARRLSGGMPSGSESQRSVPSSPTAVITGGRQGTVHGGRGTQKDRTTGGVVGVKEP